MIFTRKQGKYLDLWRFFRSTELQTHRNTIFQAIHITYYRLKNRLQKIDSQNIFASVIQVILTRKCTQIGLAAILITIGFPIRTENTLLAEEYQYPAQISRITPAYFFSES